MESFFQILIFFKILLKTEKKKSKELYGMNIDQIAMFYISMDLDSSQRTLQTNEKLSFQIRF